jgi:hypothetical protein
LVTDFQIRRFEPGPNWHYAITLKPDAEVVGFRPEFFTLLVDFSGRPARVAQLADSR